MPPEKVGDSAAVQTFPGWKFRPVGSIGPVPEQVTHVYSACPHCGGVTSERTYPDLDPPARFLDCQQCAITWDVADA